MAFDPWRDIEERPTADVAGKPVDVHTRPAEGSAFVYMLNDGVAHETMLEAILERLRRIRDASSKRVRERRFNVWYGTTPDAAGDLAAIMFPDRFDYRAWRRLQDLDGLPGYLHQGSFLVAELDGGPIARYDHGTITGYLSPTAPPSDGPADVQWRSATVVVPARSAERKWMLPPSGRASAWHTGETWDANRLRLLGFVWHLRAPGTYERLRLLTEKHFGIVVREDLGAADSRYGVLRMGFLRWSDFAIPVGVFLRGDLPDDLKYLVLAHELSHYALHFPLLYLGALVDDIARSVPEAAATFEAAVATHIDHNALERQADHFMSHFLIPARYDVQRLAGVFSEMGRQPSAAEWVWRFLQPLLPGAVDEGITWRNLEAMTTLAAEDLAALDDAPTTLYARVLKAAVERVEGLEHDPGNAIAAGLDELQATFDEITRIVTSMDNEEARAVLRQRMAKETSDISASSPRDMQLDRYELLPAVALESGQLARAIHLVPAADNPGGNEAGRWVDRHHPDQPAETIPGWRELLYDDVAIRLYRQEAWQPDPAST